MIELKKEIENFLNSDWTNTNDKEQNMQGRLYAWLLRFEQQGYVVEMETNVNDAHLREIMPEDMTADKPCKTEMDILIYNRDFSERYAAELKWIRNKGAYTPADKLKYLEDDAKFCKWLAGKAGFTETCSVVVYDFEESLQAKTISSQERIEDKLLLLGGSYPVDKSKVGYIHVDDDNVAPFRWHKMENRTAAGHDYHYYIIPFRNLYAAASEVALVVEQVYGFRWEKCIDLVMQSAWWESAKDAAAIHHADIPSIAATVCHEIDSNTIF